MHWNLKFQVSFTFYQNTFLLHIDTTLYPFVYIPIPTSMLLKENGIITHVAKSDRRVKFLYDKVRDHMSTGAEYITGADSSCLMHMQGVIDRERLPIKTLHIVEILTARQ